MPPLPDLADPLGMMGTMMKMLQQGLQGGGYQSQPSWSSSQQPAQDWSSSSARGGKSAKDGKQHKDEQPRTGKKLMCEHYQTDGVCKFGNRCHFAHCEKELMEAPKSKVCYALCREFLKGSCKHGSWCHFAHSEKELAEDVVILEAFVKENNLDQTVHNKLFALPRWILKMVFDKGSLKMNSNPSAACMMRIKESLLESELRPQDHLKPE